MKILVLTHKLKVTVLDDFQQMVKYFNEKVPQLELLLEYKETPLTINNLRPNTFQYTDQYDVVIYLFDRLTQKPHGFPNAYQQTARLVLIEIPTGEIEDKSNGYIWKTLAHEMMHAFAFLTGAPNLMDGDYLHNDDPYHKKGNFARQFKVIDFKKLIKEPKLSVEESNVSKLGLVPVLESMALNFLIKAKKSGFDLKITQGYRDPEYQDKLYAQGRTLPGKIVTNATSKTSKHCQGKAFDIAFTGKDPYPKNANWKKIGEIGEACGLKWGGRWTKIKDMVHFEI